MGTGWPLSLCQAIYVVINSCPRQRLATRKEPRDTRGQHWEKLHMKGTW